MQNSTNHISKDIKAAVIHPYIHNSFLQKNMGCRDLFGFVGRVFSGFVAGGSCSYPKIRKANPLLTFSLPEIGEMPSRNRPDHNTVQVGASLRWTKQAARWLEVCMCITGVAYVCLFSGPDFCVKTTPSGAH